METVRCRVGDVLQAVDVALGSFEGVPGHVRRRLVAEAGDGEWSGSLAGLRADAQWQHGVVEYVAVARQV